MFVNDRPFTTPSTYVKKSKRTNNVLDDEDYEEDIKPVVVVAEENKKGRKKRKIVTLQEDEGNDCILFCEGSKTVLIIRLLVGNNWSIRMSFCINCGPTIILSGVVFSYL